MVGKTRVRKNLVVKAGWPMNVSPWGEGGGGGGVSGDGEGGGGGGGGGGSGSGGGGGGGWAHAGEVGAVLVLVGGVSVAGAAGM